MKNIQKFIKEKIKEGYEISYTLENKNVDYCHIELTKLFVTYMLSLNNYNDNKYVKVTKYLDGTKKKIIYFIKIGEFTPPNKKNLGGRKMKTLNYWNVKSYASKEDKIACKKAWDKEIELKVDEHGRVFDEADTYIADVIYQENSEY